MERNLLLGYFETTVRRSGQKTHPMKFYPILLLVTMFAGKSLAQDAEHSDYIPWNEFYQLQWSDFKGPRMDYSIGDAGSVVEIKAKPYLVKRKVYYDVVALFNRGKSWHSDQSAELLDHERLHFDIAELYARKIRKRISMLGPISSKEIKNVNRLIQDILYESNEADIRYDAETLHGAIRDKQLEWEINIHDELRQLEEYKKEKKLIEK